MTIDTLLEQFYADLLLVKRDSAQTAMTYKLSAEEFLHWLASEQIKLKSVTVRDLSYYLAKRKEDGTSDVTMAKDLSGIRALGEYLVRKGYWEENTALILDRPKVGKGLPKVLSIEEVDKLLSGIDKSTPLGIRDDALFELIYSCGLRISEACTLMTANVHMDERIILVLEAI